MNSQPSLELDHLFICTTPGAPEAQLLLQFGLTEGSSHMHAGQGTANRRFFFHNLMLELLWVHNAAEAQSETTRPTHLWERWSGRNQGACPFGICLRPSKAPPHSLPFKSWDYCPAYLPESLSISVATNAAVLTEPMLFYLGFRQRQDIHSATQVEPLDHPAGLREATRLTLTSPRENSLSPEFQTIVAAGLVQLKPGEDYLMEIGFDGESQGRRQDFRPTLPLILAW